MANMGNHMDSHPGAYRTHISCFGRTILVLEIVYCLKGPDSSKGQQSQYENQQKAEKAQFGSFAQCVHLFLTLSFIVTAQLTSPPPVARVGFLAWIWQPLAAKSMPRTANCQRQ